MYIWSEISLPKMKHKMAHIDVQCQSLSIVFLCALEHKAVRSGQKFMGVVFCFEIKNAIVVLLIKNFSWDTVIFIRKDCLSLPEGT